MFDDPLHLIVPDRFEDGEQRWHAIGMVKTVVVLLVVHTYPDRRAGSDCRSSESDAA
ncbi:MULTISPECIES: BrnT family toxin [unclassified Mesorhizobium]|uniref:BrnT family toxin n=1 Tax=unclassified Mesorhizobium TaxID=325217 RepID=UPI001FE1169B|nr:MULTISPECIES: BrnT family toxin [unclassified Mesorhizobium]